MAAAIERNQEHRIRLRCIEAIAVALWFTLQSMAAQGNDLQQSGLTQYMFDIIYVTWFVQLASLLWSKFWYLYLIVSDTSSFGLVGTMY